MSDVTTVELAFRLAVTTVVIFGPALLFLGLWRVLTWLRDDELIAVLGEQGVIDVRSQSSPVDVLATAAGSPPTRCSYCGKTNIPDAPICRGCHRDL